MVRIKGSGRVQRKIPNVRATCPPNQFVENKPFIFTRRKVRIVGDFVSGEWQPTCALQFQSGGSCRYPLRHRRHRRLRQKQFSMGLVEIPVHSRLCRRRLNHQSRMCLRICASGSEGWSCEVYQWKVPGYVCSATVRLSDAGTSRGKRTRSAIPLH
jgi:hypothetical protein